MRGKDDFSWFEDVANGITPAYAGKSTKWISGQPLLQDHPRLCGEKQRKPGQMLRMQGSPPPMRGKVLVYLNLVMFIRITPAYAGKSSVPVSAAAGVGDHPRLCGEKKREVLKKRQIIGSPPPMRGKD